MNLKIVCLIVYVLAFYVGISLLSSHVIRCDDKQERNNYMDILMVLVGAVTGSLAYTVGCSLL